MLKYFLFLFAFNNAYFEGLNKSNHEKFINFVNKKGAGRFVPKNYYIKNKAVSIFFLGNLVFGFGLFLFSFLCERNIILTIYQLLYFVFTVLFLYFCFNSAMIDVGSHSSLQVLEKEWGKFKSQEKI